MSSYIVLAFFLVFSVIGCEPIDPHNSGLAASSVTGPPGLSVPQPTQALPQVAPGGQQAYPSAPARGLPLPSPSGHLLPAVAQSIQEQKSIESFISNYTPHQLISCTKDKSIATVALYYYASDTNNMRCSFLSYERLYKESGGYYVETDNHVKAPEDEDCRLRAQEVVNVKQETDWSCQVTRSPSVGVQL